VLRGEAQDRDQQAGIDDPGKPDGDMLEKIGDLVCRVAGAGVLEVDDVAAFAVPEKVADVAVGLGEHALGERPGEGGDGGASEPRGGGSQGRLHGCARLLVGLTNPRTDRRDELGWSPAPLGQPPHLVRRDGAEQAPQGLPECSHLFGAERGRSKGLARKTPHHEHRTAVIPALLQGLGGQPRREPVEQA